MLREIVLRRFDEPAVHPPSYLRDRDAKLLGGAMHGVSSIRMSLGERRPLWQIQIVALDTFAASCPLDRRRRPRHALARDKTLGIERVRE